MAPSPQTYGHQQQMQHYAADQYEQPAAYKAPSSASVSHYDERAPAAYNKQQTSYSKPTTGYTQAAPSYAAKPAPRYEEPYVSNPISLSLSPRPSATLAKSATLTPSTAQYPPMPFAWGYDINDGYGGAQYHKENGDEYGKRTGSYGYTDAYGVYRQVDYVADEHGFRATIKTNEPGTANESPADVELHAYEPPSNYYAGNKDSSYAAKPAYQPATSAPSSYAAPAAPRAAPRAYPAPRQSYARQQASYEPAQQYSSSVIVPVYQKPAKVVALKRNY